MCEHVVLRLAMWVRRELVMPQLVLAGLLVPHCRGSLHPYYEREHEHEHEHTNSRQAEQGPSYMNFSALFGDACASSLPHHVLR